MEIEIRDTTMKIGDHIAFELAKKIILLKCSAELDKIYEKGPFLKDGDTLNIFIKLPLTFTITGS